MEKSKRFLLFRYDGSDYQAITEEQVDTALPILFKPLGAPLPEPSYIASDADFVDYLTELMGGFAIPDWVKRYRVGAAEPSGWVFLIDPSDKEKRFCKRMALQIIEQPLDHLPSFFINRPLYGCRDTGLTGHCASSSNTNRCHAYDKAIMKMNFALS